MYFFSKRSGASLILSSAQVPVCKWRIKTIENRCSTAMRFFVVERHEKGDTDIMKCLIYDALDSTGFRLPFFIASYPEPLHYT